jgi:hypothetical protein
MKKIIIKSIYVFIGSFIIYFFGAKYVGLRFKGELNNPVGPYTWSEAFDRLPFFLTLAFSMGVLMFTISYLGRNKK